MYDDDRSFNWHYVYDITAYIVGTIVTFVFRCQKFRHFHNQLDNWVLVPQIATTIQYVTAKGLCRVCNSWIPGNFLVQIVNNAALNTSTWWFLQLLVFLKMWVASSTSCKTLITSSKIMTSASVNIFEMRLEFEQISRSREWWASLITFSISLKRFIKSEADPHLVFTSSSGQRVFLNS